MFFTRWLQELSAFRQISKEWIPAEQEGGEIKRVFEEFSERMEMGIEKLAQDHETRQSQQMQLEMALCFSGDAVSIATITGEIRLVNPAFEELCGYPGEKIIGLNHDNLWGKTSEEVLLEMERSLKKGNNWRGELTLTTRGENDLLTEVTAVPIISTKGEITHHIFMQRDITQRELMKKSLTEQKEFLEKIVNLTSNLIVILGPRGEWKMDNLAVKTLLADMGDDSIPRLGGILFERVKKKKVNRRAIEIEIPSKGSRYFLLEYERIPASFLIPQEKGHLFLITLSDVTGIEERNREILVRERAIGSLKLERKLAQEELATGFIYRMKQPLNLLKAIKGRILTQIKEQNLPEIEQNLSNLEEQVDNMEGKLNHFRDITTPLQEVQGTCSTMELLGSIRVLYKDRCRSEEVILNIMDCCGECSFPLSLEVMQMLMVMLVDNALESKREDIEQKTEISITNKNGELCLKVGDNGIGISEQDQFRVFEPFYTTKKGKQGLSLALLHQIVSKAEGRVKLNKSPLGGAEFVLCFPMEKES